MTRFPAVGRGWLVAAALTLAVAPGLARDTGAQSNEAVTAAFLYNFAKFSEWTALPPGNPIVVCVVGDDAVAAAFVDIVRGQTVNGHALDTWRPLEARTWRSCHLLYIAAVETPRAAAGLGVLKALPVLTISDSKGFAQSGGIIELYVETQRVRFAINVDALERSGLRLSSRLLGLAKIVRDSHVQ